MSIWDGARDVAAQGMARAAQRLGATLMSRVRPVTGQPVTVFGRVRSTVASVPHASPRLECVVTDGSTAGGVRLVFFGRRHIRGLTAGSLVLCTGRPSSTPDSQPTFFNPHFTIVPCDVCPD